MKLALALLLVCGVATTSRAAAQAPFSWADGLGTWMRRDGGDPLFRGRRDVLPRDALRSIEAKIDRLGVAFRANAAERAAAARSVFSTPVHMDDFIQLGRRYRPFRERTDRRAWALTRALWPVGSELRTLALGVARGGLAEADVRRVLASAFLLLAEDQWQVEEIGARTCGEGCFVEPPLLDWGEYVLEHAARCHDLAHANLDLERMDACYALLARARPNAYPRGEEIFSRDVLWQPTLVIAR